MRYPKWLAKDFVSYLAILLVIPALYVMFVIAMFGISVVTTGVWVAPIAIYEATQTGDFSMFIFSGSKDNEENFSVATLYGGIIVDIGIIIIVVRRFIKR